MQGSAGPVAGSRGMTAEIISQEEVPRVFRYIKPSPSQLQIQEPRTVPDLWNGTVSGGSF